MSWFFKDIKHSQLYLRFRPTYPDEVFKVIVSELSKGCSVNHWNRAVDIGCGTGQSTLPLSEHFNEVIGIDTSETQLEIARQHATDQDKRNVTYATGIAHDLPSIADSSVDLITAAQAAHWFNFEKFYAESMRVLRPGGVVALYGYGFPNLLEAEGCKILLKFYETLDGYWEKGREHIDNQYCDIFATFSKAYQEPKRDDSIEIKLTYTIDEFMGYLKSWSAYQHYLQKNPNESDPLDEVRARFSSIFIKNGVEEPMRVVYPVFILLGKKAAHKQ